MYNSVWYFCTVFLVLILITNSISIVTTSYWSQCTALWINMLIRRAWVCSNHQGNNCYLIMPHASPYNASCMNSIHTLLFNSMKHFTLHPTDNDSTAHQSYMHNKNYNTCKHYTQSRCINNNLQCCMTTYIAVLVQQVSIKRFLKRNLADV